MVPIETSSGYLANERILLPEDAVSYNSIRLIALLNMTLSDDCFAITIAHVFFFYFCRNVVSV